MDAFSTHRTVLLLELVKGLWLCHTPRACALWTTFLKTFKQSLILKTCQEQECCLGTVACAHDHRGPSSLRPLARRWYHSPTYGLVLGLANTLLSLAKAGYFSEFYGVGLPIQCWWGDLGWPSWFCRQSPWITSFLRSSHIIEVVLCTRAHIPQSHHQLGTVKLYFWNLVNMTSYLIVAIIYVSMIAN